MTNKTDITKGINLNTHSSVFTQMGLWTRVYFEK